MSWKYVVWLLLMLGAMPAQAVEIRFQSATDFTEVGAVLKNVHSANPDVVEISITLTPEAAQRIRTLTRASIGQPLTLFINGQQTSTATVQSELGGQFRMGLTRAIARNLLPTLID